MVRQRNDLKSLRDMVAQAHRILATTNLPEGRSERARELLSAAVQLADNILREEKGAANDLAAVLGMKGGKETAKRGSEYFRKIASMRKERKGGRPPKTS